MTEGQAILLLGIAWIVMTFIYVYLHRYDDYRNRDDTPAVIFYAPIVLVAEVILAIIVLVIYGLCIVINKTYKYLAGTSKRDRKV